MQNLKKISLFLTIILGASLSGCLKDKGFDNYEYGIKDPNSTAPGLGFPLGNNQSNTIGLDAVSANNQEIKGTVLVSLFDDVKASKDVNVVIQVDQSLITAYNTKNGTDIKLFKSTQYSLSGTTIKVPAGSRTGEVSVNVPTTVPLNLDSSYGIGLRIISNDGGYQIPDATKTLVLIFNLKNKYDGVYTVDGSFVDVTNATFAGRYPLEYQLVTTGPNSVDVKMLINGEITPGYLFSANGAGSFFGNWGLSVFFNTTTDQVTEIRNYYGDPTKAATGVGTPSAGSGAPLYAATNTRRAAIDGTGINKYTPDAVPTKSKVQIKYFMIQPSTAAGSNPRCKFDETWTYKKPRA